MEFILSLDNHIIYNVSGRSFRNNNLGRKISEVIACWKSSFDIEVICGGDLYEVSTEKNYCNDTSAHHDQSFRKIKFLEPVINSISEIKDLIHDRKLYAKLCEKYDEKEITLVLERSCRLHYAGYRYAKKRGVPFVLEWKDHLVDYNISLFKPYALWMERFKNDKADFIIVESEVLRDSLSKEGIKHDKILVAYNAVNADEFKPSKNKRKSYRASLDLNEGDTLVGYIGSYAFYHDTKRLIYAARIIKQKGFSNIKFLLIGNGEEFQECYDLAKQIGLTMKDVIFVDTIPKEQVPEVLASIDISVLPGSTDIICPIKVFEYMAAETALILPDFICNREVVSDLKNGVLFQPYNENDLADKIIWLSQNPEEIKLMGFQARETVKERFTWDNTWGKVLRSIIDSIGVKK